MVGPKGRLNNVRLLGPLRQTSQVEISRTDARILGIAAPLRMSGNLQGTPGIRLHKPLCRTGVERRDDCCPATYSYVAT